MGSSRVTSVRLVSFPNCKYFNFFLYLDCILFSCHSATFFLNKLALFIFQHANSIGCHVGWFLETGVEFHFELSFFVLSFVLDSNLTPNKVGKPFP